MTVGGSGWLICLADCNTVCRICAARFAWTAETGTTLTVGLLVATAVDTAAGTDVCGVDEFGDDSIAVKKCSAVKKLWSLVSTCFRSLTDARLEICGAFITGSRRCQLSQPSPGSQRPLVGLRHILRVYMCCGRDYVCCGQVTEEAGVSMPHIAGRGSTLGGCYCPDYLARALDPRVNFVPLVEHHKMISESQMSCENKFPVIYH